MSERYIYAENQAFIIDDGTIIWDNQDQNQSSLQYFDANGSVMGDSTINESYVTAIDSNETQYLSILDQTETNNVTLEDLQNLTIGAENNETLSVNNCSPDEILTENAEQENSEKSDNAEVIVFTMEGSDDLYGIQVTTDEKGDIQKYQFKFRTTAEGQLEPIPETVSLLTEEDQIEINESESAANINETRDILQTCIENANEASEIGQNEVIGELTSEINIKEEEYFNTNNINEYENIFDTSLPQEATDEEEEETIEQENLDSDKIILFQYENKDVLTENQIDMLPEDTKSPLMSIVEETAINSNSNTSIEQFLSENSQIEVQYETELETTNRTSSGIYNGDNHDTHGSDHYVEHTEDNMPDLVQISSADIQQKFYQSPIVQQSLNVFTQEEKIKKSPVNVKYYVLYPEKENVNSLIGDQNTVVHQAQIAKLSRANPRSVLRTSFIKQKEKPFETDPPQVPECDLYHKRFAKNKEAMRAKHFHTFLNKTTIPHAPIRQQRQPRKQEIKPIVERSKEEIIVQEVIISSNGFIEDINQRVNNDKIQQVTAVVELSDSEDEASNIKAKPAKKIRSISSGSETSVIEIQSDTEELTEVNDKPPPIIKKRQTQLRTISNPLKRQRNLEQKKRFTTSVPSWRLPPTIIDSDKIEIKCPHCPKTFPSQNSLNTHLIHHNLENNLRKKAKMESAKKIVPRLSLFPKQEYKHKCDKCGETFKNSILLQKHNCVKKFCCSVCLKPFSDAFALNCHKKKHLKLNLVNDTIASKITPKKMMTKPSNPKTTFKCYQCPKVCESEEKLNAHVKIHMKFTCSTCNAAFSSQLLLDTHVRRQCVKFKRVSLAGNQSLHVSPARAWTRGSTRNLVNSAPKFSCSRCGDKFRTIGQMHGHMTDCASGNLTAKKPRLYKPAPAFSGVPVNEKIRRACLEFKAIHEKWQKDNLAD